MFLWCRAWRLNKSRQLYVLFHKELLRVCIPFSYFALYNVDIIYNRQSIVLLVLHYLNQNKPFNFLRMEKIHYSSHMWHNPISDVHSILLKYSLVIDESMALCCKSTAHTPFSILVTSVVFIFTVILLLLPKQWKLISVRTVY